MVLIVAVDRLEGVVLLLSLLRVAVVDWVEIGLLLAP